MTTPPPSMGMNVSADAEVAPVQLGGGPHRGGQRVGARVSSPWKRVKWPRTFDHQVADGEGNIGVAGVDGICPGDVAGDVHGSGGRLIPSYDFSSSEHRLLG